MKKAMLSALITVAISSTAVAAPQAPMSQEEALKAFEAQRAAQTELQQKLQTMDAAYLKASQEAANKYRSLKTTEERRAFAEEQVAAAKAHSEAVRALFPAPEMPAMPEGYADMSKDAEARMQAHMKKAEEDRKAWLANVKAQRDARMAEQEAQRKAVREQFEQARENALKARAAMPAMPAMPQVGEMPKAPSMEEAKAQMDAQIKAAQEFNAKMQAAKTPEERKALVEAHMKAQQAQVAAPQAVAAK